MSRERIAVLGIALAFYALGGWSLYGDFEHEAAHARGGWEGADAIIAAAYLQDLRDHELVPKAVLDYKYTTHDSAVAVLDEDPAHPQYARALGLIGFGTLIALCRELILRRRGKYRQRIIAPAKRCAARDVENGGGPAMPR